MGDTVRSGSGLAVLTQGGTEGDVPVVLPGGVPVAWSIIAEGDDLVFEIEAIERVRLVVGPSGADGWGVTDAEGALIWWAYIRPLAMQEVLVLDCGHHRSSPHASQT